MAFKPSPHYKESVGSLHKRLYSKVYELTATVPVPHSKTVSREMLQHYRDVLVDKARDLLPQVQDLMDEYDRRETNRKRAGDAWWFGEKFIKEAYRWFEEVEEVYHEVRLKEIVILDRIRNNVELFSEDDERCAYEFIKQVEPLQGLMETEAYTVLTEELLTNTVRRKIPPHVKTTSQVYGFLIEEFGGASSTLENWVTHLELTAQSRPRGNRARLQAIEAASKLCERFLPSI